jgi:hypothetical protein
MLDMRTLNASRLKPAGWFDDTSIDPKVAECMHIASVFELLGP